MQRNIYVLVLIVAFICTACATNSPTTTHALPTPTATPTPIQPVQPVSGQELLSGGPITYVALGASDAVGVGSKEPGSQGYVPLLAEHLPTGSHTVNLGISGIRLHAALQRELPLALSTSPRLITIWLVANDFVGGVSYDSYMHDLDTLLHQLRTNTHTRIVMANLPDLTRLPRFARLTAQQKAAMLTAIKRWNSRIAAIAANYKVAVVDLFAQESQLTAHPEYVSADGFHPSPAGYVQLANAFWRAIQ
jgi:lysophospholipase L1-like esterase